MSEVEANKGSDKGDPFYFFSLPELLCFRVFMLYLCAFILYIFIFKFDLNTVVYTFGRICRLKVDFDSRHANKRVCMEAQSCARNPRVTLHHSRRFLRCGRRLHQASLGFTVSDSRAVEGNGVEVAANCPHFPTPPHSWSCCSSLTRSELSADENSSSHSFHRLSGWCVTQRTTLHESRASKTLLYETTA